MLFKKNCFSEYKEELVDQISTYSVGIEETEDSLWIYLDHPRRLDDRDFAVVCKEIVSNLLYGYIYITHIEDVDLLIFEDYCINLEKNSRMDRLVLYDGESEIITKSKGVDSQLIDAYINNTTVPKEDYQYPRYYWAYGYQNEPNLVTTIKEQREFLKKDTNDVFISYMEVPDGLEILIKGKPIQMDDLIQLIKSVCKKFGKELEIISRN